MLNDCSSILELLRTRRSASAKAMRAPGPAPEQLAEILALAVRAPDHGKLTPWRFIVIEGAARDRAGALAESRYQALHPGHGKETLAAQRELFLRAPCVVAVVSTAREHVKIPLWEQQLSAGAVCQNILLAATAMGFGCQWITGWVAYDGEFLSALGLNGGEKIAGFIYIGTPVEPLSDRSRPDSGALTTRWDGK